VPGGGVLYANFDWNWADISHSELRGGDAPRMVSMLQLGRALTADDSLKALVVYNANPAATAPNQSLVWQGLQREDLFTVVHDMWLTDTARFANVVLPAASFAESTDAYRSYWHDYAQVGNQAIAPLGESISNFQLFQQLAQRLGFDEPCFRETEEQVLRAALAGTGLDLEALRAGPVAAEDPNRTSFEDGRFPTPSGRLELLVPTYTPAGDPDHRYRFLTPKSREQHGSQLFTYERKRPMLETPYLFVHPDDATAEGLADGDPVRAWNGRGAAEFVVKISERVQPGVIASYMVRWGVNANATTSDEPADMGGNSTFHTNYVSLAPTEGRQRPSAAR
jgi:anaerobic selenocysteine-containing dehydrogenase